MSFLEKLNTRYEKFAQRGTEIETLCNQIPDKIQNQFEGQLWKLTQVGERCVEQIKRIQNFSEKHMERLVLLQKKLMNAFSWDQMRAKAISNQKIRQVSLQKTLSILQATDHRLKGRKKAIDELQTQKKHDQTVKKRMVEQRKDLGSQIFNLKTSKNSQRNNTFPKQGIKLNNQNVQIMVSHTQDLGKIQTYHFICNQHKRIVPKYDKQNKMLLKVSQNYNFHNNLQQFKEDIANNVSPQ